MRRPIWLDGRLVPPAEATMPVMAHAAHRGTLVFDFGAFHAIVGAAGRVAVFRMRDHVVRFQRSASLLGLELGHGTDALLEATRQTVAASELSEGHVRWSAFIGSPEPDLLPRSPRVRVAIAAYTPADMLVEGEALPAKRASLRLAVFDDARKAPPEAMTPLAKVAGAYTGPLVARRRAVATGADEVVLLDADGQLAEAPTSNVFAVIAGELRTPPLGRILDGITRDSVLAVARAEGMAARETALTRQDLERADEAFLTASSFPIAPIAAVNGVVMRGGAPGAITTRLKTILLAAERGDDPRFVAWTSP
jgi:branched-chain amino acid aminotransferase